MEIQVKNLYKTFLDTPVVDDVSFTAKAGQIVGLLGPNGAGKTTTIRMILHLLKPDDGEILFDGKPFSAGLKSRIGYLPEERGIYLKHTVGDVLMYFARLKQLNARKAQVEVVRHLDRFDMVDQLETPIYQLSKGQQQKVQILTAIIHDPDLLVLDEPFFGLDPLNQDIIRKLILRFREEGKTILLSTHQMPMAESLCDEFVFIHRGKVVLSGSLTQIRKQFKQNLIVVEADDNLRELEHLNGVQHFRLERNTAYLTIDHRVPAKKIVSEIMDRITFTRLEVNRPSLEDIFLQIVQPEEAETQDKQS